jgi:2-polyprenyl-3-methyl-5-hydroxy-6-metoxy-1,4-benzoquinol methylase
MSFTPLNRNGRPENEFPDSRTFSVDEEIPYSCQADGIFTPALAVVHRDEEYDSSAFSLLRDIQSRHFWYQGRHRFLTRALKVHLAGSFQAEKPLSAIDLGGGCGGWINWLQRHLPGKFTELALSDSSVRALKMAGSVVNKDVARYQTDLLRLGWRDRWNTAFLLDVLEHIPADTEVLLQIRQALKPGGLLFVTTPALKFFWSYNDEIVHHVRRYSKRDFARLAETTGMRLLRSSYFMFFLSPFLWLSRLKHPNLANMEKNDISTIGNRSAQRPQRFALVEGTHRVPIPPVNALLRLTFALETPLGLWLPFPWGTSIMGIFQKPG